MKIEKISDKLSFINLPNKERFVDLLNNFSADVKNNFDLFFLALAIAFSNSYVIGVLSGGKTVEVRAEDFIIAAMMIACFFHFKRAGKPELLKIKKTPFFDVIFLWLGIGIFGMVFNLFVGNYNFIKGVFYYLKEVEFFFIYFYVYWRVKNIDSARFLVNLWAIFISFNVAYILFQIFTKKHFGEYCLAAISERGVFPSGGFFLMSFIFLFSIFFYYIVNLKISLTQKILFGAVVMSIIFGVFGSGSKTNTIALFFSLILTTIFLFLKTKNVKLVSVVLLTTFLLIIIFLNFADNLRCAKRINLALNPERIADSYMKARWYSAIKDQLVKVLIQPPRALMFGMGKGYGETHNQYLRNVADGGLIGFFTFFILIFSLLKAAYLGFFQSKNNFLTGLLGGFLVSILTLLFIGFATEPFLVVKVSEVFWLFAAIAMAVLTFKKEEQT